VTGTGLLTSRCNPYGAEGDLRLLGGMYPASHVGRYHWYCDERAIARYRMVCTGGENGTRLSPDGGTVPGFHCDGRHRGQVMTLCRTHAREFNIGPPAGGFRGGNPVGQVGGTVANRMCPACMWPPEARTLQEQMDADQAIMSGRVVHGLVPVTMVRDAARRLEGSRARMDELNLTGRVHKCPLQLVEVS